MALQCTEKNIFAENYIEKQPRSEENKELWKNFGMGQTQEWHLFKSSHNESDEIRKQKGTTNYNYIKIRRHSVKWRD